MSVLDDTVRDDTVLDDTVLEDPMLVPVPQRVVARIEEGNDTVTLHVVPVDGEMPDFQPAQISMLGAFGIGEAAISISSAPSESDHRGYTIRRAGPITNALADTPVGGVITARGPFGRPWPLADIDTSDVVVLAGGLGMAPLRAAMEQLAGPDRDRFERLALGYGVRTPDAFLYADDLTRWAEAGFDVRRTVDVADDDWDGAVGVVPALLDDLGFDWSDTTALVCGPDVMMHFTALRLVELGVPAERIWLTLERNMQCGNALCGHCQIGPFLVCRDGPVASYAEVGRFHRVKGL